MEKVNTTQMNTLIPPSLRRGHTIGIVSPSDPVVPEIRTQLNKGIDFFQRQGFEVELAPHVLSNTLGYSATAQEKADDINKMFAAKNIDAIICSQGGYNANAVLPYLDYKLIKANAKIFLGISDITVLLNAIYSKTGMITFHGNDLMWGFGRDCAPYDEKEFLSRLVERKTGLVETNKKWQVIRQGEAQGKLLGGNLQCLTHLSGTEFFPNLEGAILFLEDYGPEASATQVSKSFHHLKQLGVFEKINALWLGYYQCPTKVKIEEIASEVTSDYNFPILQCDNFGHNTPNTVIPVGCLAKLDATNCNVQLLEHCVN